MIVMCVAAAGSLLASWILKSKSLQKEDLENILNRIEMGWSSKLYPYIAESNKYRDGFGDEDLWREMGIRGSLAMLRNAGELVALLSVIANQYPEFTNDYERAWWDGLRLRKKALKCVAGAFLHLIFRRMPRYAATECVSVYCDLCDNVDSMMMVCHPQLKQQFTWKF